MENPIFVEAAMTKRDYLRFSWFHFLRRGRHIKPAFYLLFAMYLIIFFMCFLLALVSSFEHMIETSGLYLLVLIVLALFYFSFMSAMFRITYKKMANMLTPSCRYTFLDDALVVEAKSREISSKSEYSYALFFRVFELQDMFYLYANKVQSFILPKRHFVGTDAERLAAFLLEKMGQRYVKCY